MLFTVLAALILNLVWISLTVLSIKNKRFLVTETYYMDSLYSFKPKKSTFMKRYKIAMNNLPWEMGAYYIQLSIFYLVITTGLIVLCPLTRLISLLLICVNLGIPLMVLEMRLTQIESGIDGEILTFLQCINASLQQSEDLIKSIQYAERMTNNLYLKSVLKLFNQSIQAGLEEHLAFQQLYSYAGHDYLRYIILNFEQVYFRRGNLMKLVSGLEQEYTAIQVEINKRKIELKQDRMLTLLSLTIVFMTGYKVISDNDYILTFYTGTATGNTLLGLIVLTFMLGIFIVIRATQIRY